jgi:hypothetical protein
MRTVACLTLLSVEPKLESDANGAEGRLLSATALEVFRILAEGHRDLESRGKVTHQAFIIYLVSDALISAVQGRQLQVSKEDIELFLPQMLWNEESVMHSHGADSPAVQNAGRFLLGGIVRTGRYIASALTNRNAQTTSAFDADLYPMVWRSVDENLALERFFQHRNQNEVVGALAVQLATWRAEMLVIAANVCRQSIDHLLQSTAGDLARVNALQEVQGQLSGKIVEYLKHSRTAVQDYALEYVFCDGEADQSS